MSDRLITLSEEQVTRYLQLTDRRMFIVMHSGASWKPEYAQELEDIDREIATLRTAIDSAVTARHLAQGQETNAVSENIATDCKDSVDSPTGQEPETVSGNVTSDCKQSESSLARPEKLVPLILDIVSFFGTCAEQGNLQSTVDWSSLDAQS